ncbi:MAG TPA: hypothetical protein VFI53_10395 [Myxococcaceae bacterium]|nr:hypothetical protein [Myxococcaceae bacterium]
MRWPLVAMLLGLALPVLGADPQGGGEARRYSGTFRYVGGKTEEARIRQAIDAATKGMIGGDTAKTELMKRSEVRPTYTLSFEGGKATVSSPGFPPETSPLDGSPVEMTNKYGDKLKMRQRFMDGALVQESEAKDGTGSTRFQLEANGKTLRVRRISKSPKLPRPVEYTLSYVKR